jgi:hypothetical protein
MHNLFIFLDLRNGGCLNKAFLLYLPGMQATAY